MVVALWGSQLPLRMTYRQLPGEMIEGATEIVDCVPDNQTPAIVNLYRALDIEDKRALITIETSTEAVVYGMRPELFSSTAE